MSVATIIICVIIGIISWHREKNWYNPTCIMAFLWALISFLSHIRAYNLYKTSDLVYELVTIGLFFFFLGSYICKQNRLRFESKTSFITNSENAQMNYTIIKLLCILSVVILAKPGIEGLQYILRGYDMSYIRHEENALSYNNILLRMVYNYIVRPFSFAIVPIFAADFLISKKRDRIISICTIIIVVFRVLIEGGRFVILYVICSLIVSFAITKKQIKIKKSAIFSALIVVAVSIVAIFYVSLSRGIDDLGRSFYIYLCGCMPHLSIRLERLNLIDTHTYGLASLNGIFLFIFSMLENFGFSPPEAYLNARSLMYVEDGVKIASDSNEFNAFVSPYFYMYLDGGIWGVILGMVIYGYFSYHYYKKLKKEITIRDLTLYLFVVQGLITSFVRIQFVNIYYTLAFVFIYILINKKQEYRT